MEISIDSDEVKEALRQALLSDADLLAEVDELFFREKSTYETGGLLNYVFAVGPTSADGADSKRLALRRRDKSERNAVILAPDEHGLVRRVFHGPDPSIGGNAMSSVISPKITGSGAGDGVADVSFECAGEHFWVEVKHSGGQRQ